MGEVVLCKKKKRKWSWRTEKNETKKDGSSRWLGGKDFAEDGS
ncbi:hypothetical protein Pint_14464 [Pistacia integerrima]|uniref:Uncharacterized protein n=1 Tax=Pistacia integerrima TaxID=434235 RepID=A0ACC0YCV3_9ROSI|nr:hypothetical protein Pint_14464 [Pistacia integerrima]